ncbi:MAG TPA: alpha amylase C-terminal domain-containing protein, partial [Longimicrobiales bacterium]|nr:alpha amylase C-terminal domain-containing protein [Longimicrobiales bacterium]
VAWHLLDDDDHAGIRRWVTDLNRLYREEPALHALDSDGRGFEWVEADDASRSVLAFLRKDGAGRSVLCIFNATPVPRENYRVGVPSNGVWTEILNSDADVYGGSGVGNLGRVEATPVPYHGRFRSLCLTLPPLAALFLRGPEPGRRRRPERESPSAAERAPGSARIEDPATADEVWEPA